MCRILDMKYLCCFYLHHNRILDDLEHHHLSHNREGFVEDHKKYYSVRVERGSFRSHNLTSHCHEKQAPFKREMPKPFMRGQKNCFGIEKTN